SPVPMVRGFGLLLVAGIAVALVCALTLGIAVLAAAEPRGATPPRGRRPGLGPLTAAVRGASDIAGPALRGAGDLVAGNRAARALRTRGTTVGRGAVRAAAAH